MTLPYRAGWPQRAGHKTSLLIAWMVSLAVLAVGAQTAQGAAVSVGDTTVVETTGAAGATATFTLTRTGVLDAATVHAQTSGDTATAPSDFAQTSTTVSWTTGQAVKTVDVPVVGDAYDEDDETFHLVLSDVTGSDTIDVDTGTATITDDDDPPTVSVSDVAEIEGNSNLSQHFLAFHVTLSSQSGKQVSVNADTEAGTAATPADFATVSQIVTFIPGDTDEVVLVPIQYDTFDEPDETVNLKLTVTGGSNATLGDDTGVGTIQDDDDSIGVLDSNGPGADGDVTVNEGTGALTTATFTVGIAAPVSHPITITYTTVNLAAKAPGDYAPTSGTATINTGDTVTTINVPVVGDATDENDEDFQLQLSAADGGTIADASGRAVIIDDDAAPTIAVDDPSSVEGNGANRFLTYTVSLSAPSEKFVSVDYETLAGTAIATGPGVTNGDYQPRTGTLTFAPSDGANTLTSQTVSVTIVSDSIDEANETVQLHLLSPSNATIADATGIGTILDDDGPTANVGDVTVAEGAAGDTNTATFTVTLSAVSPQDVSFDVASSNDSAVAPTDYSSLPANTHLTIPAGQTTATVAVTVNGDGLDEDDEKFRITLTNPVNGSIADGIGVATITDDDDAPQLAAPDMTVTEGTGGTNSVVLDITLNAPSGKTLLAGYATEDISAVQGKDYQSAAELLTFNPGETTKSVTIPIAPDDVLEADESFKVHVFGSGGTSNAQLTSIVTIVDDDLNADNMPRISVNDVTTPTEGNAGTQDAVFTVTLDRASPRVTRVDVSTVDGRATAPADYAPVGGTLTFGPGETSKTVPVSIVGDTLVESNQDYKLHLANAVNSRISDTDGLGVIIDDDVGGGTITLSSAVRRTSLLCPKGKKAARRCKGVLLRWNVAVKGSMIVDVRGKYAKGKGKKKRNLSIRLFRKTYKVKKPGAGSARVRALDSKATRLAIKRVRKLKIKSADVTVTFRNEQGAEQIVRFVLKIT